MGDDFDSDYGPREHELVQHLKAPKFRSLSEDFEFFQSLQTPLLELISASRSEDGRARFARLEIVPSLVILLQRWSAESFSSAAAAAAASSPEQQLFDKTLFLLLKLGRNLCAGDSTNQDAFLDCGGVGTLAALARRLLQSASGRDSTKQGSGDFAGEPNEVSERDSTLEQITARFGSATISSEQEGHNAAVSVSAAAVGCLQMMMQLLGNFLNRGEACQAAVWDHSFPNMLPELASLRLEEISGPIGMVLYICCRSDSKRCCELCQGNGATLVALLLATTVEKNFEDAPGNTATDSGEMDWFELLLEHLCLQEPLFPLLFVNLGVPPLGQEVSYSKVDTDEVLSACRLHLQTSTLTSLQASLLFILCDWLNSQVSNPPEFTLPLGKNAEGAGGLAMPLNSVRFMVDLLGISARAAVRDSHLTSVPTLTSASCTVQILGFVLYCWRMFFSWDTKNIEYAKTPLLSDSLVDLLLSLLEALGPPEATRNSVEGGVPVNDRIVHEKQEFPGKNVYVGYRRDIVAVIANISYQNSLVQDRVREQGRLLLVLQQCVVERWNPFLKEWGLWAMRNLLEGNVKNQEEIKQLEIKQAVNLPELQKMGLSVQIDQKTRQPHLVNLSSSTSQD